MNAHWTFAAKKRQAAILFHLHQGKVTANEQCTLALKRCALPLKKSDRKHALCYHIARAIACLQNLTISSIKDTE